MCHWMSDNFNKNIYFIHLIFILMFMLINLIKTHIIRENLSFYKTFDKETLFLNKIK